MTKTFHFLICLSLAIAILITLPILSLFAPVFILAAIVYLVWYYTLETK